MQRAYLPDNEETSPATTKRLLLLRAREKFLKNAENNVNNSDINESELGKGNNGDSTADNHTVVPRSPSQRTAAGRLLERLSALSSQRSSTRSSIANTLSSKRSSRSSKHNSQYNVIDVNTDVLSNAETSTEIFNVLRKLHDSIDQLEEYEESNESSTESINQDNNTKNILKNKKRDSDPLLPEERELIEGLLYKYQHLEHPNTSARVNPFDKQEEAVMFSSQVRICGASPAHSRKTSYNKPLVNAPMTMNMGNLIEENEMTDTLRKSLNDILNDVKKLENQKDGKPTQKDDQSRKGTTEKKVGKTRQPIKNVPQKMRASRKISTVKEVAGKFEALSQETQKQERLSRTIGDRSDRGDRSERKYYDISSDSLSSSSSEYEEDIVKTHEGFIIPDDAIHKLTHVAQHLQEEEEEIERQFKKENFLKDIPTRKGIRMPSGSTGKVNQLKSKFEGKNIGKKFYSLRFQFSFTQTLYFDAIAQQTPCIPSSDKR